MLRAKEKYIVDLIVKQSTEGSLVLSENCDCSFSAEQKIFGAQKIEYYDNLKDSVRAWLTNALTGGRYWSVHYKGKHLISVDNDYGITQFYSAQRHSEE